MNMSKEGLLCSSDQPGSRFYNADRDTRSQGRLLPPFSLDSHTLLCSQCRCSSRRQLCGLLGPMFAFRALHQITATASSSLPGHVDRVTGQIMYGVSAPTQEHMLEPGLLAPHSFLPNTSHRKKKNCFWTHSTPSWLTRGFFFSFPETSIFFFSEKSLFHSSLKH